MALILGPVLRHVGDTSALVWVQTEQSATVEILGCSSTTFEVQGFHYAVVEVEGLTPDAATAYEVRIDGQRVWPEPDTTFPPSVIKTRGPDAARPRSDGVRLLPLPEDR